MLACICPDTALGCPKAWRRSIWRIFYWNGFHCNGNQSCPDQSRYTIQIGSPALSPLSLAPNIIYNRVQSFLGLFSHSILCFSLREVKNTFWAFFTCSLSIVNFQLPAPRFPIHSPTYKKCTLCRYVITARLEKIGEDLPERKSLLMAAASKVLRAILLPFSALNVQETLPSRSADLSRIRAYAFL